MILYVVFTSCRGESRISAGRDVGVARTGYGCGKPPACAGAPPQEEVPWSCYAG
jgi:hypothetical protein